jgi:hypothetical protein
MTKKFLIVLLASIQICVYSQRFLGLYKNNDQTLNFSKDSTVMFSLYGEGGLTVINKGKGKYIIKDGMLFISTKVDESILHSDFKIIGNNPDTNLTILSEIDQKGVPISFGQILIRDNLDKRVDLDSTVYLNREGKAAFISKPSYASIELQPLGYDPLRISFSKIRGKKIVIIMPEWVVVEDKILVFYIQHHDEEKIILTGPLDEKYIRLIQHKKVNRFHRKMKNDNLYIRPQTRLFFKSDL